MTHEVITPNGKYTVETHFSRTKIGMSSCVGIMGQTFPLGFGNYFALWGGPYVCNMWVENFEELVSRGILDRVQIKEYKAEGNRGPNSWAIVVDPRVPESWLNNKLCFNGCGSSPPLDVIIDMFGTLGVTDEAIMEQYTNPVEFWARQGYEYKDGSLRSFKWLAAATGTYIANTPNE